MSDLTVKLVSTSALLRHCLTSKRSFVCVVAMSRHTAMMFCLVLVQRMSNSRYTAMTFCLVLVQRMSNSGKKRA